MADADEIARRREIRQRKILENSEARLKKITGKHTPDTKRWERRQTLEKDYSVSQNYELLDSSNIKTAEVETSTPEVKSNISDGSSIYETKFSSRYGSRSAESFQTDFFTGLSLKATDSSSNGTLHRVNLSDSYSFPKKVSDAETRSFGRTRADSRRNSSCKNFMMETLQFSSLKCTVLRPWLMLACGIFMKFIFVMYESYSLSQSLLLPYILLELSLYIWMKLETQGNSRPASQSLLLGVLFLCGVSSHVISILNSVLNTVQYLVQDFAIFLFSFVFSHVLYENYVI